MAVLSPVGLMVGGQINVVLTAVHEIQVVDPTAL